MNENLNGISTRTSTHAFINIINILGQRSLSEDNPKMEGDPSKVCGFVSGGLPAGVSRERE